MRMIRHIQYKKEAGMFLSLYSLISKFIYIYLLSLSLLN
jgi:hypothetical protein